MIPRRWVLRAQDVLICERCRQSGHVTRLSRADHVSRVIKRAVSHVHPSPPCSVLTVYTSNAASCPATHRYTNTVSRAPQVELCDIARQAQRYHPPPPKLSSSSRTTAANASFGLHLDTSGRDGHSNDRLPRPPYASCVNRAISLVLRICYLASPGRGPVRPTGGVRDVGRSRPSGSAAKIRQGCGSVASLLHRKQWERYSHEGRISRWKWRAVAGDASRTIYTSR